MPLPDAPLRLSLDVLAAAETAARQAGLTPQQWIERLVLRETESAESAPETRQVGPEDEVRGGPEATEQPAHPTDDWTRRAQPAPARRVPLSSDFMKEE